MGVPLIAMPSLLTSRKAPARRSNRSLPVCRHCGIPTAGPEEAFCCAGCAYVHRLVHEEGLGAYYQIKDRVTAPAEAALLPARDFQWLQEAQANAELKHAAATPELYLDVQGISCAGCVWLIERVFSKQQGAGRIDVNAQTGQLRLSWQRGQFDSTAFARSLQSFNYLLSTPSTARSATPESRALVRKIGLCAAFAMNVMLFTLPTYFGMEASFTYARLFSTLSMVFGTLSLLAGGGYFIGRAFRSLREGAMNIDLPIALGIVGAYGGSFAGWLMEREVYNYFDFVSTFILLMLVGRWAQTAAVERNQRRLLAQQPTPPRVKAWTATGTEVRIAPEDLALGQRYVIPSSQTVPVESRLHSDGAEFNLSWINGESAPRTYQRGQRVPAGAICLGRTEVQLEAIQPWAHSLLAELMKPVARAEYRNRVLDRVIQGYLVAIIAIATLAGAAWWWGTGDLLRAGAVVTAILVVSCPCAIGLSFPLADEMATVALRARGVFVRVGDVWHRLQKVRTLVFDKTGTLTLETPTLQDGADLRTLGAQERQILFTLVQDNPHPVARCLAEQLMAQGVRGMVDGAVEERVGQGVSLRTDDRLWKLGRPSWALNGPVGGAAVESTDTTDTVFSCDGSVVASFRFQECARADAVVEIQRLQRRGLTVHVLSGDRSHKVRRLTEALGLRESAGTGEMTPQEKARWLEDHSAGDAMMLGDGANDSLAFDRALCRGTPVVHRGILAEKADFYYLGRGIDGVRCLFEVDDVRRMTHRVLLVFSISYNLLAVGLAVGGSMNPLLAAIMMPLSSLLSLAIVGWGMKSVWRKQG